MNKRIVFFLIAAATAVFSCTTGVMPGNTNDNASNGNDNTGNGDAGGSAAVEISIPNEGAEHVSVDTQVTYESNPPASGPHWSMPGLAPTTAGLYEVTVEEEQWVHNLEHGYIVILYDCGGPCGKGLLNDLQGFFNEAPPSPNFGNTKLVIAPYDGLPHLHTAVAWDVQLHLDAFDRTALLEFYDSHLDRGPQAAP